MKAIAAAGLAAIVALGGAIGCSEDTGPSAAVRRYCDLVARFPTLPESEGPEEFQQNMARFVEGNHDYFEELIDAAPSQIKGDVESVVVTLRRVAAGELGAFDQLGGALREADEFEEENCS